MKAIKYYRKLIISAFAIVMGISLLTNPLIVRQKNEAGSYPVRKLSGLP